MLLEFENLRAIVPGGIYSDLMNNKIIPDVFSGYNDVETRWVATKEWTYSRSFDGKRLKMIDFALLFLRIF